MTDFLPFIIFLMILAVFLRAESALTVFYMVIGIFILGYWWNRRAISHIEVTRDFGDHAFLGDEIAVNLIINNRSILPVLWLEIHESLPVNLRAGRSVKHVFSMGIRDKKEIQYQLNALKRGYYALGPLLLQSGDPLGLVKPEQREVPESALTIYPRIVNLGSLGLPSRSPFGTLKHHNPIFEDPSKMMGKREYQDGDSIRRIDWKSTASTGKLQVKIYEASIALEVAILLDLHRESYDIKTYYDATELAVTAAASIAAWGKSHKQSIGLTTTGVDPLHDEKVPHPLPPRKGSGHFINILEILARLQPGDTTPIDTLIQDALADLTWGTTIVLISGGMKKQILDQLFQARKRGLNPVIILTGHPANLAEIKRIAAHFNIPLYSPSYPHDLRTMGNHNP